MDNMGDDMQMGRHKNLLLYINVFNKSYCILFYLYCILHYE